ncbi:uncharacterized protein [Zea mays]|nr:uncharacterized protein LOC100193180 isoform X4 [Zea mays]
MAGRYGMQSSGWPFGNGNPNQFLGVPKDWRNGDWFCSCGSHNYSSRTQCKECGAPVPSSIPSTTMKATSDASSSTACGSLDMNSTWYDLVKDAKDRECFFKARDDDFFARTMDQFRLMQNSQVTDNVSRWNIECQCAPDAQLTCDNHATIPDKAPDAQLTGDNRATIPDKAQVVEPAHAEQVPMQSERAAEKTWQLCLNQLSHIPSFAPGEQLTDEKVVEPAHAKQVHLAQLSPSPSRERARLSQFAQGAQLTDEEAAALEEEDHPQIDLLDGLRRGGRLRGSGAARLAEVRRRRRSGVLTSMASLSSKHHVLIQVLLARGPLSERDFHAFIDGAFGKNTALGTKRLASEDLANDWDNKRLNPGNDNYPLSTGAANNLFLGIEQGAGSSNGQSAFPKFDNGSSVALPSGQGMSGLMGKGAKWRDGDWLCNNCNNHNYASRAFCNRCKTQKESAVHPGVL